LRNTAITQRPTLPIYLTFRFFRCARSKVLATVFADIELGSPPSRIRSPRAKRAQRFKGASANLRFSGLSETSKAVEIVSGALALSENTLPHIHFTQEIQHLAVNYTRDELMSALDVHIACLNRRTDLVDDWLQSHRRALVERLSSLV